MNHAANLICRILCETSIQGLIVLVIASIAARILRRASAANRCLVWQTAAASLVLLPVLSVLLPVNYVPVSILPARISTLFADPKTDRISPLTSHTVASGNPIDVPSTAPSLVQYTSVDHTVVAHNLPALQMPVAASVAVDARVGLAAMWLLIAIVLTVEAMFGHFKLRRLRRGCTELGSRPLADLTVDICKGLGIRRRVLVLQRPHAMPMAWGWMAPVVLLPTEASEWPLQRVEMVLRHELAHIQRGDWPMQRFGRMLCCIYWFHPLAWICLARMKQIGEGACDDVVLASGIQAPEYAAQLLEVISNYETKCSAPPGSQPRFRCSYDGSAGTNPEPTSDYSGADTVSFGHSANDSVRGGGLDALYGATGFAPCVRPGNAGCSFSTWFAGLNFQQVSWANRIKFGRCQRRYEDCRKAHFDSSFVICQTQTTGSPDRETTKRDQYAAQGSSHGESGCCGALSNG